MNVSLDEINNINNASNKERIDKKGIQIPVENSPSSRKQNDGIIGKVIYYRQWSSANLYAAKKTVAQGMMDIALISANANQLHYILEYYDRRSSTYRANLFLITLSMCLQVIVGIILIFKGRYDVCMDKFENACRLNNYVVFGVFLITVINVFIAAFM